MDQYKALLEVVRGAGGQRLSVYRCCLYLGDLARYREQYEERPRKSWDAAEAHYRAALDADPRQGSPHNQLAVLAGYARRHCVALYHYVRSIHAAVPFPTARQNLGLLFETVHKEARKREHLLAAARTAAAPMTSRQRTELLSGLCFRFAYLHATLALADDAKPLRAVCDPLVARCEAELAVLHRKWAVSGDLQLAMVVACVHSIIEARRAKPRVAAGIAEDLAFALAAVSAGLLSVGGHDLTRPDLLAPLAVFLQWLRRARDVDLDSAAARRLWAAIGPAWAALIDLALQCPRTLERPQLPEERRLTGFTPLWESGTPPAGPVHGGGREGSDREGGGGGPDPALLEGDEATKVRAWQICSFFDWLANQRRVRLPFDPPVLAAEHDEALAEAQHAAAALASAAAILDDHDDEGGVAAAALAPPAKASPWASSGRLPFHLSESASQSCSPSEESGASSAYSSSAGSVAGSCHGESQDALQSVSAATLLERHLGLCATPSTASTALSGPSSDLSPFGAWSTPTDQVDDVILLEPVRALASAEVSTSNPPASSGQARFAEQPLHQQHFLQQPRQHHHQHHQHQPLQQQPSSSRAASGASVSEASGWPGELVAPADFELLARQHLAAAPRPPPGFAPPARAGPSPSGRTL